MTKRYKKYYKIIAAFLITFSLISCNSPFIDTTKSVINQNEKSFEEFCNEEFKDTLKNDAFSLNFLIKDKEAYGLEDYKVNLGEYRSDNEDDEENNTDAKTSLTKVYNNLKKYNYNSLSEEEKITYKVLENHLTIQLKYEEMKSFYNVFAPSGGIISNLPINYIEYNIDSKKDVEEYIELVKMFEKFINENLEYTKKQSEEGLFMADFTLDKTLKKSNQLLMEESNPMILNFNKKVEKADFLTLEEKEIFIAQNKEAVEEFVLPSLKKTIDVLEGLRGTSTNDEGLSKYKGGKKYYENLVKELTGTSKSMKELIKAIDKELNESISKSVSLVQNNKNLVKDIESYRNDMEADDIVYKLKSSIGDKYPEINDVQFNVEYQDKSLETEGVIAYYMSSPLDDYKNNNIKINGSETKDDFTLLYTTLAHESFPGHLYQHVYSCENNISPIRFLIEPIGYTEGWAEYVSSSSLSYLGLSEDFVDYMTELEYSNQLLVSRIDIAVNYEGFSREELSNYLKKLGINSEDYTNTIFEVVASDPGICLPYGVGHLEMRGIRNYAETELKDKFNEKEFNEVILKTGPVQFELLKERITKYVKETK